MSTYVASGRPLLQEVSNKITKAYSIFLKDSAAYSYIMDDKMIRTSEDSELARPSGSEGAASSVKASLSTKEAPDSKGRAHLVLISQSILRCLYSKSVISIGQVDYD